jgi:hypothetical protein
MTRMPQSAISTTKSEPGTLVTFASLRFSGDRLEPALLTEMLNTAPTTAYRKGEIYKRSRGREVRGRTGVWLLSSEGRVDSLDLNDHIKYLLDIIFPSGSDDRLKPLQHIVREDGVEADIGCFWHGEHGARPPVITDDIRARLARIPAEIETDFDTD